MNKKVLFYSIWITKILLGLCALLVLTISGLLVYWHFDPAYFDNWYLLSPFNAGTANMHLQLSMPVPESGYGLNELATWTVYWLWLRTCIFAGLVLWSLVIILRILNSVKDRKTFYTANISHFKKLGSIGIYYALLATFNFGSIDHDTSVFFTIPTLPIVFAVGCYVLAIVFEEGNSLQEDVNSIV